MKRIKNRGNTLPLPTAERFSLKQIEQIKQFVIDKEYERIHDNEVYEIAHKKITEDVNRISGDMLFAIYEKYYTFGEVE